MQTPVKVFENKKEDFYEKGKELIAVLMAGAMVLSLAACGGSGKDGGSAANGNGGEAEGPITGQTLQVMISEEPGGGGRPWQCPEKMV